MKHIVVRGRCYVVHPCSCPAAEHWLICTEHNAKGGASDAERINDLRR